MTVKEKEFSEQENEELEDQDESGQDESEEDESGEEGPEDEESGESDDEEGDESEEGSPDESGDDDEVDGQEAIREQRRAQRRQRKAARDEAKARDKALIDSLQRSNEQLVSRLDSIENRNANSDLAQLDNEITRTQGYIDQANQIIADAFEAKDAQAFANAQKGLFMAQKRLDDLSELKKRATTTRKNPAISDAVKTFAKGFSDSHPWYDSTARDQDSKVVLAIDTQVMNEGFNPNTQAYWDELSRRVKKYLPHRFTSEKKVNNFKKSGGKQFKSPVGKSNREAAGGKGGSNKTFNVSKDRADAMKQAGLQPGTKEWNAMAKRYRDYDKQQGGKNG